MSAAFFCMIIIMLAVSDNPNDICEYDISVHTIYFKKICGPKTLIWNDIPLLKKNILEVISVRQRDFCQATVFADVMPPLHEFLK